MKINKNPEDNYQIENAIKFLVSSVEKTGINPKPLLTHSIRVAFLLDYLGYKKEIVMAALLHDLLEDTKVLKEEIKEKFGKTVTDLVSVCTFDKDIIDKEVRYKKNFNETLNLGSDALAIRAADLIDNSYYYNLVHDKKVHKYLLDKVSYFLELAKPIIGKDKIYKKLRQRINRIKEK